MRAVADKVLVQVFSSLYQYAGAAILLAILFMVCYREAKKTGWKELWRQVWEEFKSSIAFRRTFYLVLFVCLILLRTVLCRQIWGNPIGNILGSWNLHYDDGGLRTEPIENVILFIPYAMLMLWVRNTNKDDKKSFGSILWYGLIVSVGFSIGIEACQVIFRVGTLQLSDLVNNTIGGIIGSLFYWICFRIHNGRNK